MDGSLAFHSPLRSHTFLFNIDRNNTLIIIMNHLSCQGIIAFLAAVVTTTSMAERSSSSQACTDGDNYRDVIVFPGNSTTDGVCPGIDVVLGRTSPFQRQDDFPGNYPLDTPGNSFPRITSNYEFWVDGKKEETLMCFKSKGLNVNKDVSDDGTETGTVRGHFIILGLEEPDYKIIFSGLNTPNVTLPGLYYFKGGGYSYTLSSSNETGTVVDYTKITGDFVDICAELEAVLEGGGGEEEDTCADKAKDVCKNDVNCKWRRKKGKCVPVPMPWK